MAQARYSALDLRGSPGLDPSRSVGVSPMPTIAALFVMLIKFPCVIQPDHRTASCRFQLKNVARISLDSRECCRYDCLENNRTDRTSMKTKRCWVRTVV